MELLRIGICDDEQSWHCRAKEIIKKYSAEINCKTELVFFFNREQLLSYEGLPLDSVFMDIELEGENGIELSSVLNKKYPACAIVYVTNYLFYATDSYSTDHIYFVLKERFEQKIGRIFDKIFREREQAQTKLIFEVIGETSRKLSVSPNELLYFERSSRRTHIHTAWGEYAVWEKIDDIEKRLPQTDFVRCHNSFIVYLPAAREITADSIVMKDGTIIAISRKYANHTKTVFTRWASAQMI